MPHNRLVAILYSPSLVNQYCEPRYSIQPKLLLVN
nr:MAG TPA: hypothetical protein [Caudoviricetes sp.]